MKLAAEASQQNARARSNWRTEIPSLSSEEVWSHPGTPLRKHLEQVGQGCVEAVRSIPLTSDLPQSHIAETARLVGFYHDIGKATPFFQEYLREQNPDRKARLKNHPETSHSLLSAVAAYLAAKSYLDNNSCAKPWNYFLPIFAFLVVRRHHTDLRSAYDDLRLREIEVIKCQIANLHREALSFLPYWSEVQRGLSETVTHWPLRKLKFMQRLKREDSELPYLLCLLLYSALLDADKHAAAIGERLTRASVPTELVDKAREKLGYDRPISTVNHLRDELYRSVTEKADCINLKNNRILSLTAPTGSGKTLALLSFALRLRDRVRRELCYTPRVVYALPFLSIIDQNAEIIQNLFKEALGATPTSGQMLVHHHLSDFVYKTQDSEYKENASEVLVEGWNSELVITTFVQLFYSIFSNRNRALRKFHRLAGSIVILDEIQSFPPSYWLLFRETAEAMSQYLGTFFVLVTATQPAIFLLPHELVENKEHFFASFQRITVKPRLDKKENIKDFAGRVLTKLQQDRRSTLIVVNTIAAAEKLYKQLKPALSVSGFETYYLSSLVVPAQRLERIVAMKESKNSKTVISTQLIEAGVDIDLERAIRDVGPMDSIVQVAGRANRNMKSSSADVEIVSLVDERGRSFNSYIYDRVLTQTTEELLADKNEIPEKYLLQLVEAYYSRIKQACSDDESRGILAAVRALDFEEVRKFRLIKDKLEKVDIFVELNDEAATVWSEYLELDKIADRFDRRLAFKRMRGRFFRYVVSPSTTKAQSNLPPEVNGMRYVGQQQLNEYYDLDTGFKTTPSSTIW